MLIVSISLKTNPHFLHLVRLRNKYNMKIIIGTQIGFLIANVILMIMLDFNLKMVIANHLIVTLGYFFGYFCRYIQERVF